MKGTRRSVAVVLGMAVLNVSWAAGQVAEPAARGAGEAVEAGAEQGMLGWQNNYDAVLSAARQSDKPVLVIFGAPWCEWCRKLNEDLKTPEVQRELGDVERVYVDFDENHELARKLGVGPIPALRIVKAMGRTVAVQDGYLPAARLIAWLQDGKKAAASSAFDPVLDADDLSDETVAKLVGMFGDAETSVREAALRRLLGHRDKAAGPVVKAFEGGTLAVRLTALDLLESWRGPVEGLDPWRVETLTKERLGALETWAASPAAESSAAPALDERTRAEARDLIGRMLRGSDEDAAALRERLARYGTGLLPEVYGFLKDATTDGDRERLTLLRYRVAASDALALQWPAGLERLASAQVKVRHSALEELGNRATARDTGLLLELFSDPDALVRETALRLLQKVGGSSATDALANLLKDPDPNVRAAVLKSVAEAPSGLITAKIAEYVGTEKDVDLVVHAARVLRNAKAPVATKTLYTLLENPSWRVRAEAAEALTEKASEATPEQRADFYARMLGLLDDPDGFVASRALTALERAEGLPSLEKIARTADKHPELAAMAIGIMANNLGSDPKGITYIRGFVAHKDGAVRAATIGSLAKAVGASAADDLHRALADADERVQVAASEALLAQLEGLLPQESYSARIPTPDLEVFLARFHSGPGRPVWLDGFRPDLEKELASKSVKVRFAAALPLIALGYPEKAVPVVKEAVAGDATLVNPAAGVLTWLPWDERLALFDFMKEKAQAGGLPYLARGIAAGSNAKAVDALWGLLEDPKASWDVVGMVDSELRRILLGSEYEVQLSPARKKAAVEGLVKRVESGNVLERTVALAILSVTDPVVTAEQTAKILADPAATAELKRDAFQVQLSMLPGPEAESVAAGALAGADSGQRMLALDYLATGAEAVRYLHGSIYLRGESMYISSSSGTPITPTPPKGLKVEQVRPLLADQDPRTAAIAGYLLALYGDRSGMEKLLEYYRTNSTDHDAVCRLVYRAVAALNDDAYTPLLAEIYKTLAQSGTYELREFYWTIRSMTGDKCLDLRKRIRDEVGMDALR